MLFRPFFMSAFQKVGVLIQKIDPISMRLAGMIPSMAIARTRQLRSSIQAGCSVMLVCVRPET